MKQNISLIIMSAGESRRFRQNCAVKKHWIRACGKPLWLFVADSLNARYKFAKTIITANANEVAYMKRFCDYEIVCGGDSRQKSLENALVRVDSEFVAVSDAARFGLDFEVLDNLFAVDLNGIDCVIPTLGVADTIFMEGESFGKSRGKGELLGESFGESSTKQYLNRNAVKLVQTPQISRVATLQKAMKLGDFSDESSAINALGGKIICVEGSDKMHKLTHFSDLERILSNFNLAHFDSTKNKQRTQDSANPNRCEIQHISQNTANPRETLIGYGFDTHRFCKGDEITLCGVKIKCDFGIEAHSDGDVALHALMDALLGAVGAGDIGEWFPPNDERFKDADSLKLLAQVVDFVQSVGFGIVNVDMMILAETPKITPHKDKMIKILSESLHLPKNRINIKATTMEKMGFVGRKEGICAKAVVSIKEIATIC